MKKIFHFGEKVKGYNVNVMNEREVRASAGILFLFAIIVFMNAWLVGNFLPMKVFVIGFMLDFFVRIFINPKFSPSLILSRCIVSKQKVEYVGAAQKKFAWIIGFILAVAMFYLIVLNNIVGPLNFFICILCLGALGFEAFFGICIGCKLYNLFNKEKATLCPGGACEFFKKEKIQKVSFVQVFILIIFISFLFYLFLLLSNYTYYK